MARQFTGLDAYQKVIASGVDVVLLTTPPGFRPQHLKAAVDAFGLGEFAATLVPHREAFADLAGDYWQRWEVTGPSPAKGAEEKAFKVRASKVL